MSAWFWDLTMVSCVILYTESESGLRICPSHQVSKINEVKCIKNNEFWPSLCIYFRDIKFFFNISDNVITYNSTSLPLSNPPFLILVRYFVPKMCHFKDIQITNGYVCKELCHSKHVKECSVWRVRIWATSQSWTNRSC